MLAFALAVLVTLATPAMAADAPPSIPESAEADAAAMARWGIEGKLVRSKLPIIHVTVDERKVLASLPALRAAGLADAAQPASPAQSAAILQTVTLRALPGLLRTLYAENPSVNYVPVSVDVLPADTGEGAAKPFLSFNSSRPLLKRLREAGNRSEDIAAILPRFSRSAWLEARLGSSS